MVFNHVYHAAADSGGLRGIKTTLSHGGVPLDPPVSLANITVKEHVYRPTSELVPM